MPQMGKNSCTHGPSEQIGKFASHFSFATMFNSIEIHESYLNVFKIVDVKLTICIKLA